MGSGRDDARRVGVGYDLHQLVDGRVLVLGGVDVSREVGFDTPSDGDVLCHALIDALAGGPGGGRPWRPFPRR